MYRLLKKNKEPSENDILNIAMDLSLEWGENWLAPVDERLKKYKLNISDNKAKEIDIFIRKARNDIFDIIEQFYLKKITENEMKKIIAENYPFLNCKNLNRLQSQGMYYAWKNNG